MTGSTFVSGSCSLHDDCCRDCDGLISTSNVPAAPRVGPDDRNRRRLLPIQTRSGSWDNRESLAASLSLPSVKAAIAKGRPLIAGFSNRVETTPLGGHGLAPAHGGRTEAPVTGMRIGA